jgi:predicted GNAT family acetyltransferase
MGVVMAELQTFPDAEGFLAAAGEALYENEPLHSLMIGVVERLIRDLHFYGEGDPYLAVVSEGGVPVLAATMTPPFGLLLSALREDGGAYIPMLVSELLDSDLHLPDVHAESRFAKQFAEEWETHTGETTEKIMEMRIYVLHQVTPPQNVTGEFSQATLAEHELITEWLGGFEREALNEERAIDRLRKAAEGQIERGEWYLWWDDGKPRSMCLQSRPTRSGICVSGVYTPPELRGRGYASAGVAALSQHLLDEGYSFTSLFTDLSNPTSNSIYMKIGYQPLADFDRYKLGSSE